MELKTIDIRGKKYVEVKERVKYFRQAPEYKGWALITEILKQDDKQITMRSIVQDNENRVISTGHAQEKYSEKANEVNFSSALENCETSANGRALANLGIGIDAAIASADEMIKDKPSWWSDAIKYLNDGGKIETITQKYNLSEDLKNQLMEDAIQS